MPFTKTSGGKYRSPSGRTFNEAQVRLYYAGGGKFPGEKKDPEEEAEGKADNPREEAAEADSPAEDKAEGKKDSKAEDRAETKKNGKGKRKIDYYGDMKAAMR
jgi:hypothetical protein